MPELIYVLQRGELLPVSFFISLHIVEQETGSFMPAMNVPEDSSLAERKYVQQRGPFYIRQSRFVGG